MSDARPDPDRIVGRGAYDMAGGLAAAMVAAAAAASDLAGDLVLAFAADEEFGSVGMEELLAAIDADAAASADPCPRPDAAVVLEPTDLEVTLAHRGFAWYRVEYEGLAAHGSQPELGVDAIDRALDGLVALRAFGAELARPPAASAARRRQRARRDDRGRHGCRDRRRPVRPRRRAPHPAGRPDPGAELERVLAPSRPARIVAARRPPGDGGRRRLADRRAPCSTPSRRATGAPAVRRGDPWWTDAGLIAEAGIPVVLVGPVGGGAHADEEWVSTDSLESLVDVLEGTIRAFCDENGR